MGILHRISRLVKSQFVNHTRQFEDILQDSDEELRRLIDELSARNPQGSKSSGTHGASSRAPSSDTPPRADSSRTAGENSRSSSFDSGASSTRQGGAQGSGSQRTRPSSSSGRAEGAGGASQRGGAQSARHQAQVQAVYQAYKLLGIPPTASVEKIKSAYREKIRLVHPDKVASESPAQQESAKRKAQEINMAYEVLARVRGFK